MLSSPMSSPRWYAFRRTAENSKSEEKEGEGAIESAPMRCWTRLSTEQEKEAFALRETSEKRRIRREGSAEWRKCEARKSERSRGALETKLSKAMSMLSESRSGQHDGHM